MSVITTIVVHANRFDSAILHVLEARDQSIRVRNVYCGRVCWLPLAGLEPYNAHEESYDGEYVLADWFRAKLSHLQEAVLQLRE